MPLLHLFWCLAFLRTSFQYIDKDVKAIIGNFTDYYKVLPPKTDSTTPVTITASLNIESIPVVSGHATLELFLIQVWIDDRLRELRQPLVAKYPKFFNRTVSIGEEATDYVWSPNTMVYRSQMVARPNAGDAMWFDPDGTVTYLTRLHLVLPCNQNINFFPFDSINCSLQLGSSGFSNVDVVYVWGSVTMSPMAMSDDGATILTIEQFSFNKQRLRIGEFSMLQSNLVFKRQLTSFALETYLPSALIVCLSWISFWINRNATPARASISLTTVLTMLTLATNDDNSDEKIRQSLTARDVYVWVCFIFVIAATIEFALTDYVNNKHNHITKKNEQLLENNVEKSPMIKKSTYEIIFRVGHRMTYVSRLCFPLAFTLFNVFYVIVIWIYTRTYIFKDEYDASGDLVK